MSTNVSISRKRRHSAAFSFTELLVVIAIIAVLIALLFPMISRAQQSAQQIKCAAQLNQITTVVQIHANAHQGYAPLVGLLNTPGLGPSSFMDLSMAKYSYLSFSLFGESNIIMAFTSSLAREMGDPRIDFATSIEELNDANSDPNGYMRIFRCPAHLIDPGPLHQFTTYAIDSASASPTITILNWADSQSYIYNEAALGWNDSLARGHGYLAHIHKQTQTMLMADGIGGPYSRGPYTFTTLYNKTPAGPVTVADALAGNSKAGDPGNFDPTRHHGHINIAFFDSHVETRDLTAGDLSNVYLIAP